MQFTVIEDAQVLKPNQDHKNFTATGQILKKDTIVNGETKFIEGLRRGEPFKYRLFLTNNKQFIHLNKIKPMTNTEVTLGADAKQTPTVVNIPATKKLLNKSTVIGGAVGGIVGFSYAKHKKLDKKKTIIYSAVGIVAGYLIGKYIENRKAIVIKPAK